MKTLMSKNGRRNVGDSVAPHWRKAFHRLITLVLTALSIALFAPTTLASGPNSKPQGPAHGSTTKQDPQWIKAKLAFRVSSGIVPDQGKGANTHPSILSAPFFSQSAGTRFAPDAGAPASSTLGTGPYYVGEPSDGKHVNFPESNWQFTYDDKYNHYADYYMFTLCGPGAADVTTDYWPLPANLASYAYVSDPLNPTQNTSWNGTDVDGTTRMRGYMLHLAAQIEAPTWASPGMFMQSKFQSGETGGATLQVVRDAINWEASGENPSDWAGYFYIVTWNSSYTTESAMESALHQAVVNDVYYNHVPVIVEIPAGYLPNWPSSATVYHFVTIVGYNDSTGQYQYVDTCKAFTHCNYQGADSPDFHPISQHQLAQGVYSINTSTQLGDGGWVW